MAMLRLEQIAATLGRKYLSNRGFFELCRPENYPYEVSVNPPNSKQILNEFPLVRQWQRSYEESPWISLLVKETFNHRVLGEQKLITKLRFNNPAELEDFVLKYLPKKELSLMVNCDLKDFGGPTVRLGTFKAFYTLCQLVAQPLHPSLMPLSPAYPRRFMGIQFFMAHFAHRAAMLGVDLLIALQFVDFFAATTDIPCLYLRQFSLPHMHTKFVEQNYVLIDQLLTYCLPPERQRFAVNSLPLELQDTLDNKVVAQSGKTNNPTEIAERVENNDSAKRAEMSGTAEHTELVNSFEVQPGTELDDRGYDLSLASNVPSKGNEPVLSNAVIANTNQVIPQGAGAGKADSFTKGQSKPILQDAQSPALTSDSTLIQVPASDSALTPVQDLTQVQNHSQIQSQIVEPQDIRSQDTQGQTQTIVQAQIQALVRSQRLSHLQAQSKSQVEVNDQVSDVSPYGTSVSNDLAIWAESLVGMAVENKSVAGVSAVSAVSAANLGADDVGASGAAMSVMEAGGNSQANSQTGSHTSSQGEAQADTVVAVGAGTGAWDRAKDRVVPDTSQVKPQSAGFGLGETECVERGQGSLFSGVQHEAPQVVAKITDSNSAVEAEIADFDAALQAGLSDESGQDGKPWQRFLLRWGFRLKPELVRLRSLDPEHVMWLDDRQGFQHTQCYDMSLSVEALNAWHTQGQIKHVLICENEICYLSLPPISHTIAIWGSGYKAAILGRVGLLRQLDVVYWGDLDTHGFAILNQLRFAAGPQANIRSMLMDLPTLERNLKYAVTEKRPYAGTLDHLTPVENSAYAALNSRRLGHNLRLEQELIPFDQLLDALHLMLPDEHIIVPKNFGG